MRTGLCWAASVLGFVLSGTVSAQTVEIEEKLQLELLRLRLQQLQTQQLPKHPTPKIIHPVLGSLPSGAIARLGDSRMRHAGPTSSVIFSPDGKQVISGGQDGTIRVWNPATGESIATLQLGSTPTCFRFTPDGARLVVGTDNAIRFLHPETLACTFIFATSNGSGFDLSPDGKLIVSVEGDEIYTVTELETGLPKLELTPGSHSAFHPDGKHVALADQKGRVTLYRLAGGKPVVTFDHGGSLNGIVFSPDGKRLATGGTKPNIVKVWDIDHPHKLVTEIPGTSHPRCWIGSNCLAVADASGVGVYDLSKKNWVGYAKGVTGQWAVSPDGTRVAATGINGLRIRIWDLTSGQQLHADNDTFPDPALLLPTSDGQAVFILTANSAFHWPVGKPAATQVGTLPGKAVVAAVSGGRLAVVTPNAVLIYDNFDPAQPLPAKPSRILTEHASGCRSVAVSADGSKVAYSGDTQRTVIANAASGTTIRVLPHQTVGLALAFSHDGQKLAVLGRDALLRLWPVSRPDGDDVSLWQFRIQRGNRGTVAFSPDGKLLAASSSSRLTILDASEGKELFAIDRVDFDEGIYQHATFSPDGRLLITGSSGLSGTVQVWEVATRSLVRRFTTGMGSVHRLGVFADGLRIVSAGAEEVVTIWDLNHPNGQRAPTIDELLAAWGDLDSLDAANGFRAVQVLKAGGAQSVRVIAAGLQDMLNAQKNVKQWIKHLDCDDFPTREAATKALLSQGLRALPAVQTAAAHAETPEARNRAAEIANKLAAKGLRIPVHGFAGDTLRLYRAVQVLEDLSEDDVVGLLGEITKQGGLAADAAKEVLKRRVGR